MGDQLLGFLKKLKLERGQEEFVLPRLTEWERGGAAKVLKEFCRMIGITVIKFHDLRATFITNLLTQGESKSVLERFLAEGGSVTLIRKADVPQSGERIMGSKRTSRKDS